jgi:ABC-type bacteriocin/lantibiotic exporter with double-glycine peptidase domain
VFAAMLIAAAWRTMAVRWQRWVVLGAVSAICVAQAYGPLFGRVPPTGPSRVADGVHRQSTLSTCSAAAAATLLGAAGIATTETEMADLCLTRAGGTLQLGLYRGLRLKTPGMDVEFLNGDFDAVVTSPRPVIASLGDGQSRPFLQRRVGHSVVILGRDADGRLDIADPMTGSRYPMTPDAFRRLWAGEAMRLRPKNAG